MRVHVYEYVSAVQDHGVPDTLRQSMQWIRLCCLAFSHFELMQAEYAGLNPARVAVLFAVTPEERSAQHSRRSIVLLGTHVSGSAHIHTQQEENTYFIRRRLAARVAGYIRRISPKKEIAGASPASSNFQLCKFPACLTRVLGLGETVI